MERGLAEEATIDGGLADDSSDVSARHGPAREDRDRLAPVREAELTEGSSDRRGHLRGIDASRRPTRPDRPDRLLGDRQPGSPPDLPLRGGPRCPPHAPRATPPLQRRPAGGPSPLAPAQP